MTAPGALELLLNRARRRVLTNVLLDQASVAFCVAAAAAILLLILGTQILDWYWPLLLAFVAGGIGVWRARKSMPGIYRVAQIIDARLGLHDALSTAYHFFTSSKDSDTIQFQRDAANELARGADVEAAIPVRTPRSAWVAVGLVAIVCGMFGVRYGITHSLSLEKPIAPMEFSFFSGDEPKKQATNKKSLVQEKLEEQMKQLGIPLDQIEAPAAESDQVNTKTTDALATPEGKDALQGNEDGQSIGNKPAEGPEQGENNEKGEGAQSGKSDEKGSEEGAAGSPEQSGQQGKPQDNPQAGKSGNQSNDGSLSSKLRDALANLMSKMKSPPKQAEGGQQQAQQQGGQGQKGQQQAANQKGMQGKSQGEGQGEQNQQGDQQNEAGDQGQSGQSKSGEKGAEQASNPDSKSGVGKQDGDKNLRDAEQLAAMGRISELLGRRSQQVTGEMTVEVPSGKQQLKTAYSQKKAAHVDAGGEANRDEVPLIYQPYVQKYFEEVRKMPAAGTPPASKNK